LTNPYVPAQLLIAQKPAELWVVEGAVSMLAYIFWHWPQSGVISEEYEARLRTFHDVLRDAAPIGFRRSLVWHVKGAPWLPPTPTYEDWYLLDDTCGLDAINESAVAGTVGAQHDAIAALAADGVAGLYKPVQRAVGTTSGAVALWFSKPTGMAYSDLYSDLEANGIALAGLWQRMLVLGPTPEFCLLIPSTASLHISQEAIAVNREPVWS
jgi:hypothetical protein